MKTLRLGEVEQYEISDEVIERYNLREGDISPFTRLKVVDLNNQEESDIKEVSKGGSDIKEVSKTGGSDIKEIKSNSESDIKEIRSKESDIKEIK